MIKSFDTLKYTKGAEAIGVKREHAEYQAEQMYNLIETTLSTKNDLKKVELSLKTDIEKVNLSLRHEMDKLESKLTIKIGGMIIGCTGLIISVLVFLINH